MQYCCFSWQVFWYPAEMYCLLNMQFDKVWALVSIFLGQWACQMARWLTAVYCIDVTLLKLFPYMVSLYIWGNQVLNKTNCFRSDNMAVAHIINSFLLRQIALKCLAMNKAIRCQPINSSSFNLCDLLSWYEHDTFRPNASIGLYPMGNYFPFKS